MSAVTILDKTVEASVIKVRRGEELEALRTARSDGQDNAVFKIGADTYVASGLGIHVHALGELKADVDVPVEFQGRKGTLIHADNEQDDKGSMWFAGAASGLITAVAVGGGLAGGGGFLFVLAPVLSLLALGAGGLYIKHIHDNRAKAGENRVARHGTPV